MEPHESELEGRSESFHPIKPAVAWVIELVHGYPWWGHSWALEATAPISGQQQPSEAPPEPCRTPLPNPDAIPQSGGRRSPMHQSFPDARFPWGGTRLLAQVPCAWFPIPSPLQMFISEFLLPYLLSLTELVFCHILFFYYQNNKFLKRV